MSLTELIKFIYSIMFRLIGFLPVKSKLVIFESFLGKQYSDNPRALYEYLNEHHPEYQLCWSVDPLYVQPFIEQNIPYIKRFSLKWLLLMPRARYWIINTRTPKWMPKPRHTTFLQTWHGTPLKRLGLDMDEVYMPGVTTEKYKKDFIEETNYWDLLVSPNRYSTDIFKRAFHFNKEVLETGYPRNDYLIQENNLQNILALKNRLNLPQDKKIILYAPTWRDDQVNSQGKYKLDLKLDLKMLQEAFSGHYILILRLHYLIAEQLDLSDFEGFAYDFSQHNDIRELYLISDLLITDYSSVFFDYGNLRRPMLFFVYDIDNYREKLRGFYFDIEKESPGPIVKTNQELLQAIQSLAGQNFGESKAYTEFYDRFCYLEKGNSSKKVIESVFLNKELEVDHDRLRKHE